MMKDWRKYLAEMLGTMVLVLLGCGTAVFVGVTGAGNPAWVVATALAFGLALVAVAYTIGTISGAHINPAVSLAMALRKKLSWKDFAFYVLFQFLGAIIGAAILFALVKIIGGPFTDSNLGSNMYSGLILTGIETWKQIVAALVIEIVLTFIFVLTIMGVTRKSENKLASGLVIGLTLVVVHLFGIMFTGTSVNPARSFGPALFGGIEALKEVWLFIVAPLIGGAMAACASWCLFKGDEDKAEKETVKAAKAE